MLHAAGYIPLDQVYGTRCHDESNYCLQVNSSFPPRVRLRILISTCVLFVGPLVWYQKFEYAVGHWFQKATEHVLGCVLCSPGCFSLFRGSALLDDNIMKKYTIKASQASDFLQYDQGL